MHKERSHTQEKPVSSTLASVGLRLSDWFERWFPDAFALALAAVAVVFVAAMAVGNSFVANGAVVRRRFLGSRRLHDADVDDRRHRVRRGDVTAGLRRDQETRGVSAQRPHRGSLRRPVLDAGLAGVVELQPDLQRAACARGRPTACAAQTIGRSAQPRISVSAACGRWACPRQRHSSWRPRRRCPTPSRKSAE